MLIDTLKILFDRDLRKLKAELGLYKDERKIWHIEKNIANSAGNLTLHLIGNLNAFIGAEIGKTNYIRHRELEFSQKDFARADLLKRLDETLVVVDQALSKLTEKDLNADYPLQVFAEKTSMEYFLVHLSTHLSYHLGQINYHRRLLDDDLVNAALSTS